MENNHMFLVQMFQGIGDIIYQRHFVKKLAELKGELGVFCAYPQLLHDIPNLKFWYQNTSLRTQERNIKSMGHDFWAPIHRKAQPNLTIGYDDRYLAVGKTIPESFANGIKQHTDISINDYTLDMPLKEEWVAEADKVIKGRDVCIVRVPTLRREWSASPRNPKPGVMKEILSSLPKDIITIGVGYHEENEEWPIEEIKVNESYQKGELAITTVAAMISKARLTVAAVGYATPMSIAVKGRCLTLFGGHVGPEHIFDKRMDLRNTRYVAPEPFCDCFDLKHSCEKSINIDVGISKMKELLNA